MKDYEFYRDAAIQEQRDNFFKRLHSGDSLDCPCCGRYAQIYRRKITSTMAAQIIEFYKAGGADRYVHLSKVVGNRSGAGDFSKLHHWGLIVEMANDDPAKKSSGLWQITHDGVMFLRNNLSVAAWLDIYNGRVVGIADETVKISQCFKQHFHYQELMAGI